MFVLNKSVTKFYINDTKIFIINNDKIEFVCERLNFIDHIYEKKIVNFYIYLSCDLCKLLLHDSTIIYDRKSILQNAKRIFLENYPALNILNYDIMLEDMRYNCPFIIFAIRKDINQMILQISSSFKIRGVYSYAYYKFLKKDFLINEIDYMTRFVVLNNQLTSIYQIPLSSSNNI